MSEPNSCGDPTLAQKRPCRQEAHAEAPASRLTSLRAETRAERDECVEHVSCATGVDRFARTHDTFRQVGDLSRCEKRRGRVQHDDVALGSVFACQDRAKDAGVLRGVATGYVGERRARDADLFGRDLPYRCRDLAVGCPLGVELGNGCRTDGRDFVHARMTVHDEDSLRAQPPRDLGHHGRQTCIVDAQKLPLRAGRVRERPEDVEDRPDPDLSAGRPRVAHARVQRHGEEEADPALVDAASHVTSREAHIDAERLEHIRAPRRRRHRAVAVFGHGHSRARHDECGRRRDVEGVQPVAAGPARVDVARRGRAHGNHPFAHRAREADDLVGGLALHPHRHDEGADLGRCRIAVHDRAHHEPRFFFGERATRRCA